MALTDLSKGVSGGRHGLGPVVELGQDGDAGVAIGGVLINHQSFASVVALALQVSPFFN
jgi:hypothetical protein